MDEVVKAGEKHRKAALDLKVVAENLKKKVIANRERESKLMEDIDNLEMEVREKHDFSMLTAKKNNHLENEVKILIEKLEVKTEERNKLEFVKEKQTDLSNTVIKVLKEEIENLNEERKTASARLEKVETEKIQETVRNQSEKEVMAKEINQLEEDIIKLQMVNKEKQKQLKDLSEENEINVEKLKYLQEMNENLVQTKSVASQHETPSLEEELGLSRQMSYSAATFECNTCVHTFHTRYDLKRHIQNVHVEELERKILLESETVVHSLFKLKQKELKYQRKPCRCANFCRIHHSRFNWKKHESDLIFSKLRRTVQKPYSCNLCDNVFSKEIDLITHQREKHRETESGEVDLTLETHSSLQGGLSRI